MFVISLAIILLYAISLIYSEAFWLFRGKKPTKHNKTNKHITLIVVCKDEEDNLPTLLKSIKEQIDEVNQIILASDHSKDKTFEIMQEFATSSDKTIAFQAQSNGKKRVLNEAVSQSKGEYIVFTDGDCILPTNYFKAIKCFLSTSECDMAIGSVAYRDCCSVFENLQSLDFASLQATTAYFAHSGNPIMCNGANLICKKSIWERAKERLHYEIPSGDDIFLLHYIKSIGGKIEYIVSPTTIIQTYPKHTIKDFFLQRKRWASKSGSYKDKTSIFIACLVLLANLVVAISMIASIIYPKMLFLWILKFTIDTVVVLPFLKHTNQLHLAFYLVPLSVIYPFYTIYIAFSGLFSNVKWKTA